MVLFAVLLATAFPFIPDLYSQISDDCDMRFINYLVNRGDFKAALFLIDSTDCKNIENDSLFYLKGWCLYSLQQLNASAVSLLKVSPSSSFYAESRFFAAYDYTHSGNLINATNILKDADFRDDKLASLKNFELSGIYLLQNDISNFKVFLARTESNRYEISGSAENLKELAVQMDTHKSKSPLLAGALSGFLPGAGKFYAGKRGEAIAALFSTAGLGAVTFENYRKRGIESFATIAFGTAFLFSYVANIYGAVLSVRVLENEYDEHVKNTILFNLHIPLRTTFNK